MALLHDVVLTLYVHLLRHISDLLGLFVGWCVYMCVWIDCWIPSSHTGSVESLFTNESERWESINPVLSSLLVHHPQSPSSPDIWAWFSFVNPPPRHLSIKPRFCFAWSLLFEWQALVAWDVFRFWPVTKRIMSEIPPLMSHFSVSLTGIHHHQQQFHLRSLPRSNVWKTQTLGLHVCPPASVIFTCTMKKPTPNDVYIFTSMFGEC